MPTNTGFLVAGIIATVVGIVGIVGSFASGSAVLWEYEQRACAARGGSICADLSVSRSFYSTVGDASELVALLGILLVVVPLATKREGAGPRSPA